MASKKQPVPPLGRAEHREMLAALLMPYFADRQGRPIASEETMNAALNTADRLIAHAREEGK